LTLDTNVSKKYILDLFDNINNFEVCHKHKRENNLLKEIEELDIA
jgi:hypothetical protein